MIYLSREGIGYIFLRSPVSTTRVQEPKNWGGSKTGARCRSSRWHVWDDPPGLALTGMDTDSLQGPVPSDTQVVSASWML